MAETFPCGRVALTPKSRKTEENCVDTNRESANLSQYHGARNSSFKSVCRPRQGGISVPNDGPEWAIRKDVRATFDAFLAPARTIAHKRWCGKSLQTGAFPMMAPSVVDHAFSFMHSSVVDHALSITHNLIETEEEYGAETYVGVVSSLAVSPAYSEMCSSLSPAIDRDELRWVIAEAFLAGRNSATLGCAQ
jgi:hypothetical protein